MSSLVVVGYDNMYKAEEVRLALRKLQTEYLIDLEDAVVATKDAAGKVKLHQSAKSDGHRRSQRWFLGRFDWHDFFNADRWYGDWCINRRFIGCFN
ncbi:DUF1269 domain-containing protein [Deefgea sp. CFH1-16]|uniref:DUF1269 domain-containing protein n=1 Tax=Deefgea sp. CFH1-16 TaxID=2675457 RepID=UPI00194030F9|nr:hypothetical protein [Deefgea sp. CFH1-16]